MIRSQKPPIRPVYNPSSANETIQSSTNAGDIQSYIGKILMINHHQVIVEDILGQGGFAFVFLVRAYNQQRYALKRMYVNNQRDLQICQREISLVKELSTHPNIIKYVDSSIQRKSKRYYEMNLESNNDDDVIYEILLLTQYCSNGALVTRLNKQHSVGITLNERQILRIFADICSAVSACHFRRPQPILHRDIKLENILIDSQQNYILCDFGSAILLSPSTTNEFQQYQTNQLTTNIIQQLEEEIQRYTTLSYRAPEMIDLYSRLPITLKVDIWAMGCLLYKLMYNTLPFGDSILAIQNGTFVIPDDMSNIYSRELNLFVKYLLEIDINKRPDIWQVSYLTYKLLGMDCPIPNRLQSKIPDLKNVSMPLTDSEFRHQRTAALSKAKSTSTNLIDESSSHGTAVNPRERPRGMIAPSTSLINFNQRSSTQTVQPLPAPPSSSSLNSSRSGSAAQLMFDDDFAKIPSHGNSLTNIPTKTTTTKTEQIPFRARPSPPATISAASSHALRQQLIPPPPPSSSNFHSHRRSASQTISSTNNQSSFTNASSGNTSNQNEQNQVNLLHLKTNNTANHHTSTEEAKTIDQITLINLDDGFDHEDLDDEQRVNPFLHAPFHHSPASKQTFDLNSIMIGKRTSAFAPYQKPPINSLSSNPDVFTNAPFNITSKSRQHNDQKKPMMNNIESKSYQQHPNLSFNNSTLDDYY
jgi:AP2-associated kinase